MNKLQQRDPWAWLTGPRGDAHDINFTWQEVHDGLVEQRKLIQSLSDLDLEATATKCWKDNVQNINRSHDPISPIIREERKRRNLTE